MIGKAIKTSVNSIMKTLFLSFISLYKLILSPWMGGNCRFYPSCSDYAEIVYQKYSFPKASFFFLKRLLSCHPLGPRWREEPEIQKDSESDWQKK